MMQIKAWNNTVKLTFVLVICVSLLPLLAGCSRGDAQSETAAISFLPESGSFEITYKGAQIAAGTVSVAGATDEKKIAIGCKIKKTKSDNGAFAQTAVFSAGKQADIKLKVSGVFSSKGIFPCAPEKNDNLLSVIRVASGFSKSRLNTGVYCAPADWALYFNDNRNLAIEYAKADGDADTFTFEKEQAGGISITFKPDFYKSHLDHPYYNAADAHLKDKVPCGWISWKAYGGGITEKDVKTAVDFYASQLRDYGLDYIIIDDGWFSGQVSDDSGLYNVPPGIEWTKANHKFPSGMDNLAAYIHTAGFKAGIWISPFGFSGDPEQQPDYWIRQGIRGKFLYNEWHGYHYADASNPGAVENWITRGVRAQKANKVDLFKLDGMHHVAYEGYANTGNYFTGKGLTWQDALRTGWQALVDTAGGGYVLSCWGRVPEIAGIPHAIRIGQDKDSDWIYIPIAAEDLRLYLYEHNIIWCDDPDHIVFRDLTPAAARTWATLVGITGTFLTFSDKPENMNKERLSIFRKVLPVITPSVRPLNLFSYEASPRLWMMEVTRDFDNWVVAGNCAIDSSVNEITFSELGLDPDADYTVFDFWNGEFRGVYRENFLCGQPGQHDSAVYGIRKLREYPWLISVDRHISQGGVSIRSLSYDNDTLRGIVGVVKNDPYRLFVYTHGRKIISVKTPPGVKYKTEVKGYCAGITLVSPETADAEWEIRFGEADNSISPIPNDEYNPALKGIQADTVTDATSIENTAAVPDPDGGLYLSDLEWKSSQNGWGPAEKNLSNGENGERDGARISIGNTVYNKGLGVHAESTIVYRLSKKYSRFRAWIGIDDETGGTGSAVFKVMADGKLLFESGVVKGGNKAQDIDLDVKGKNEITLVVSDGGDGIAADHADWASARVIP